MIQNLNDLRNRCQPKDAKRPWSWSEKITRSYSIYFTKPLIKWGLSANQVSLLSVIVGLFGCLLLLTPYSFTIFLGAILLIVWDALDCSDGEVARYRGQSSLTGLYVDRMAGLVVGVAQYVFIGYLIFNITNDLIAFAFAFSASISRPIATLTSSHMQVSAIESFLYDYKKHAAGASEEADGGFIPDLNTIGVQTQGLLLKIGWFFYKGIGKHFLFVAALILDFWVFGIKDVHSIFHCATGLYLVAYGVLSTLAWIGMTLLAIKKRSTESFYKKILEVANRPK
jgi:hypothetical protein